MRTSSSAIRPIRMAWNPVMAASIEMIKIGEVKISICKINLRTARKAIPNRLKRFWNEAIMNSFGKMPLFFNSYLKIS